MSAEGSASDCRYLSRWFSRCHSFSHSHTHRLTLTLLMKHQLGYRSKGTRCSTPMLMGCLWVEKTLADWLWTQQMLVVSPNEVTVTAAIYATCLQHEVSLHTFLQAPEIHLFLPFQRLWVQQTSHLQEAGTAPSEGMPAGKHKAFLTSP